MSLLELPLLALAVWRICRLLIEDVILSRPRDALLNRVPPTPRSWTYALTCYWCLSIWVSAAVIVFYLIVPAVALPVIAVFALSALAGLLQDWRDRQ